MSMEDAQLDALMGRLNSTERALRVRADQLDDEADTAAAMGAVTAPGRTPELLRVIATEFRKIADSLE